MIDEKVANLLIADVNELFSIGDWCQAVPKYQTWSVLFDREEPHWVALRNSFIQAVLEKYKVECEKPTAWCHVSLPGVEQDPANNWHVHKGSPISAVMYLTMPVGGEPTHLMLDGAEVVLPRTLRTWNFFNSDVMHRTGSWDHTIATEPRYCIAAAVLNGDKGVT